MANYAVVNAQGIVINMIVWDGEAEFDPPEGTTLVPAAENAEIGGTYDGSTFIPINPPPAPDAGGTETQPEA